MNPSGKENPWKAVAVASAIAIDLLVFMVVGYFAGSFLSDWTGGSRIWIVIGIMIGFAAGVISVIFLLRRILEGKDG